MIVTFPLEDDPYYSAPPAPSYPQSANAALTTPALVRKYIDLAKHMAGGVFPVGQKRFWHGGVHLAGKGPVRAVANGTIVAYRLDPAYQQSSLDWLNRMGTPGSTRQPRLFSGSFVLIRHEFEATNHVTDRYVGAHFYSLYANLLPQKGLLTKAVLPPFLTTGGAAIPVSALRGDEVTVTAVIDDGHRMVKVRVTDINSYASREGWIERMYLDVEPRVALAPSQKIRLGYPIAWLYACHPSEKQWLPVGRAEVCRYPVRVGQVIGYPGITDGNLGAVSDSFHFEIFTSKNALVKPMKPLAPLDIQNPNSSHQDYVDGTKGDGMGKVWLTRNARLAKYQTLKQPSSLTASEMQMFAAGSCFIAAIPCAINGEQPRELSDLICFKLYGMDGKSYYAYACQQDAAIDGRDFVRDAWVTLTTDSDWIARGWQTYEDRELNTHDDGFVEDDDAVMQAIVTAAHKSSASLNLDDLHAEGVDAILRTTAIRFHTEWDSDHNSTRYEKLQTGAHPPLPQLTDDQFNAFLSDVQSQQFWRDAGVMNDGRNATNGTPLSTPMDPKNWHFHPVGFLAQMRECLATDATLSEEAFELEILKSWNTGLKLIEKRLKQLEPWAHEDAAMPLPPPARPAVIREYATLHTIHNVRHTDFWSNFEYWFGITPNDVASPESLHGTLAAALAGHHVYKYLKGMREFFKHISMQRVVKGALGYRAGAYVFAGVLPDKPLVPARSGFQMEYINIGCEYGPFFRAFSLANPIDQNRMEVQLHEVAHLRNTAHANDQKIELAATVADPYHFNQQTAYGARAARVLAEFTPNRAMANAENIAFFIESAKDEA
ncbi:hypothetical protein [Paraburkholderia xenovorans]